ncbi:histidinol-phosphate phosphatase family protein [Halobacteroides halobius DSM 5150]|uniref:D,D-heptose 1,7-bisphosphate phosphatase n=1 Tax=Halobacteroides halobius (strain ATCC 35273 / DSM 5150 / MD-1) TaxID=748449 RepID=L0KBV8_HALHC|nr:HAD family hydrolase [Halobacteroides halobius]AGB41578.1 histidinol-phosphate phosphatase family protein [Halobacteroides halobius DSM 5150]
MNKAVFLDRDGVINNFKKPVNTPQELELYPWTAKAIKKLNQSGYQVYIVTNQGGIECGYLSAKDLARIHQHLIITLKEDNAIIDDIEYCPHFKTKCECRKPNPGMILKLANKYNIDLDLSFMVGDRKSDIIAGQKAGCKTIKVGSKYPQADFSVENLAAAVDIILKVKTPISN